MMDARVILRLLQRKHTLLRRRAVRCRIIDSRQSLSSTSCLLQERTIEYSKSMTYKEKDPLPYFLKENVQTMLKRITGFDKDKLSELRTAKKIGKPQYKIVPLEELRQMEEEYARRQKIRLQMPPVMQPWQQANHVLIKDEKLAGALNSKIVFTDISEGVPNTKRAIVVRDKDGTLRLAEPDERDRILHVYYPRAGKLYHIPKMFEDKYLEKLLNQKKYKYILNSACTQFEPNDPEFYRVTTKVYEHINKKANQDYDLLRSSRHFGPMVFYYAWHYQFDGILIDMLSRSLISGTYDLICLVCELHPELDTFDILPQDQHADTNKILNLVEKFVQELSHFSHNKRFKNEIRYLIRELQGGKGQEKEAAAIQQEATFQQEATAIKQEEATIQQEASLQVKAAAIQGEATIQQEATAIQQETTVQEEATAIQQETTVQEEATAIQQETTVQQEATAIQQETTVQEEATAIQQETTVQEEATAQEEANLQNKATMQQEAKTEKPEADNKEETKTEKPEADNKEETKEEKP